MITGLTPTASAITPGGVASDQSVNTGAASADRALRRRRWPPPPRTGELFRIYIAEIEFLCNSDRRRNPAW